jgi:hypothetical protein
MDDILAVSPGQFSQISGLSLSTVRRRIRDGSLPAIQLGGFRTRWMVAIQAIRSAAVRANHDDAGLPAASVSAPLNGAATIQRDASGNDGTPERSRPNRPDCDVRPRGPRPRWMITDSDLSS